MKLAEQLGVPCPRTVSGASAEEVLDRAANLNYPVAVKPRVNGWDPDAQRAFFNARYQSAADLALELQASDADALAP